MRDNDPVLRDRDIDFGVNNGVVTVKGEVRSADEKNKVTDLVRAAPASGDMANAPRSSADTVEPSELAACGRAPATERRSGTRPAAQTCAPARSYRLVRPHVRDRRFGRTRGGVKMWVSSSHSI